MIQQELVLAHRQADSLSKTFESSKQTYENKHTALALEIQVHPEPFLLPEGCPLSCSLWTLSARNAGMMNNCMKACFWHCVTQPFHTAVIHAYNRISRTNWQCQTRQMPKWHKI